MSGRENTRRAVKSQLMVENPYGHTARPEPASDGRGFGLLAGVIGEQIVASQATAASRHGTWTTLLHRPASAGRAALDRNQNFVTTQEGWHEGRVVARENRLAYGLKVALRHLLTQPRLGLPIVPLGPAT